MKYTSHYGLVNTNLRRSWKTKFFIALQWSYYGKLQCELHQCSNKLMSKYNLAPIPNVELTVMISHIYVRQEETFCFPVLRIMHASETVLLVLPSKCLDTRPTVSEAFHWTSENSHWHVLDHSSDVSPQTDSNIPVTLSCQYKPMAILSNSTVHMHWNPEFNTRSVHLWLQLPGYR